MELVKKSHEVCSSVILEDIIKLLIEKYGDASPLEIVSVLVGTADYVVRVCFFEGSISEESTKTTEEVVRKAVDSFYEGLSIAMEEVCHEAD